MKIPCFISSPGNDIPLDAAQLDRPFLLAPDTPHPFLKLGDYFHAIQTFLLKNRRGDFLRVLNASCEKAVELAAFETMTIRSEKQGALYHVSSVDILLRDRRHRFAIITAMTEIGRNALHREFETLDSLTTNHPHSGLPEVYFRGDFRISRNDQEETLSLFVGEWLEGYHEWHLSRDDGGRECLCIWDQDQGYYAASEEVCFEIFRQASKILTLLYDPHTHCQIHPWHHAAGDFAVRSQNGKIHIRLTTARGYRPLMVEGQREPVHHLAALLYFFLDMTVRMRLDKWDGIGGPAWAEGEVVRSVVTGFLDGLDTLTETGCLNKDSVREFLRLLQSFTSKELKTVFGPLIELYRKEDPGDLAVIEKNLDRHVNELHSIIERLPG